MRIEEFIWYKLLFLKSSRKLLGVGLKGKLAPVDIYSLDLMYRGLECTGIDSSACGPCPCYVFHLFGKPRMRFERFSQSQRTIVSTPARASIISSTNIHSQSTTLSGMIDLRGNSLKLITRSTTSSLVIPRHASIYLCRGKSFHP